MNPSGSREDMSPVDVTAQGRSGVDCGKCKGEEMKQFVKEVSIAVAGIFFAIVLYNLAVGKPIIRSDSLIVLLCLSIGASIGFAVKHRCGK